MSAAEVVPEVPLAVASTLRTVLRLGRGLCAAAQGGVDAARRWVADCVPAVVRDSSVLFRSLLTVR